MLNRLQMLGSSVALAALVGSGTPAKADDIRDTTLFDQDGRTFSLASLHYRTTFLTFIATRCTDTCPVSEAVFTALAREVEHRNIDIGFVMLTLDPEFDTPFVLSQRARELDVRAPRFRFAWANRRLTQQLERNFGVRVETVFGMPDAHSAFIYVLDKAGNRARTIPLSTEPSALLTAMDKGDISQ